MVYIKVLKFRKFLAPPLKPAKKDKNIYLLLSMILKGINFFCRKVDRKPDFKISRVLCKNNSIMPGRGTINCIYLLLVYSLTKYFLTRFRVKNAISKRWYMIDTLFLM